MNKQADLLKSISNETLILNVWLTALEESTHNLIYFLPLIVTPITGAAGYYFGYRNIGLVGQFIYKTDRAKNKKLR